MTYGDFYKRWLSSAPTEGYEITALEIVHPAFGTIRLANNTLPLTLKHEDFIWYDYQAANFVFVLPSNDLSTSDRAVARFGSLEGQLYEQVKRISVSDPTNPIKVTHRTYISTKLSKPSLIPPPLYEVENAEPSFETIDFTLRPPQLPNVRVGDYYLPSLYPGLVEI